MSGGWLISYIILWIIVIVLSILVIRLLEQFGTLLRHQREGTSDQVDGITNTSAAEEQNMRIPPISEDGPVLDSIIPEFLLKAYSRYDAVSTKNEIYKSPTLVVCMTPLCESCQHIVDPLNRLIDDRVFDGKIFVILRADETSYQAFLSIFPLHMPVICDQDRTISMGLNIHRSPFGLLYNSQGNLIRKGSILSYEAILALLGDTSASPKVLASIYPSLLPEMSENQSAAAENVAKFLKSEDITAIG